jgi:hypothetical protein
MRTHLAIVLALTAACGKSDDKPAASRPANVTDEMVATADRYVDLMTKLGADLEAAGTDCKKATAALRARGTEAEAIRDDVQKLIKGVEDAGATAWFDATYSPRMKAVGARIRPTFEACQNDRELGAAAASNLLLPRKKRGAPP